MHYQEKLDEIFKKGNLWKHRTLRTIFDPFSSEWNETSIEEKLGILKTIQENGIDIQSLIIQYKRFYNEENKPHVSKSVEDGLRILLIDSLK